METIINQIEKNSVIFLSKLTNNTIQNTIKEVYKQGKPKIIFTAQNNESLMCLHSQLRHQQLDNELVLDRNCSFSQDIVLCNSESLYYQYVKKGNQLLADIIIFYDSEVKNFYYDLVWQLWKNYEKEEKILPRLLLLDQGYNLENIPFIKHKDNCYEEVTNKIKIRYAKTNFNRNSNLIYQDIISNIDLDSANDKSHYLILFPQKRYISTALTELRKKYKKYEIYSFDENICNSTNAKIFTPIEKCRIIITTHLCASLLHFKNTVAVYDSCQISTRYYGNYNIYWASQKSCNHLARESKKVLYRACTEENFKTLDLVENKFNTFVEKSRAVLTAYYNDHDISIEDEEEIIKFLEKLNLIRAGKVTEKSSLIFNSPLSIEAAKLIHSCHEKKQHLFPVFVLANIIDKCKHSLLFIPNTIDEKEFIGANYKGMKDDNLLIFYMNIFLTFFKKYQDMNIEKDVIQSWCQMNNIHSQTFYFLITQIRYTIDYYRDIYNFEICLFDSKNIIDKMKEEIAKVYADSIYTVHEKEEHIYEDRKGKTAVLDKKRFFNIGFFYPEKIINFYKINNVNSHDIILFYMTLKE